jgi:hypothetical protein
MLFHPRCGGSKYLDQLEVDQSGDSNQLHRGARRNCSGQSLPVPVLARPLVLLCNLDLWGKQCTRWLVALHRGNVIHVHMKTSSLSLGKHHAQVCMKPSSPSPSLEERHARVHIKTHSLRKLAAHPISTAGQPLTFFHHTSFSGQKALAPQARTPVRRSASLEVSHHALQVITCVVRTALCGKCPLCDVL